MESCCIPITRSLKLANKLHVQFRGYFKATTRTMSSQVMDKDIENGARGHLTILKNNHKRFKRIRFLGELFKSNGYELRIAGGAVRDILKGKEPLDIDFATTARPEESLALLKKHEDVMRIIVTAAGQKHGTVAVKFKEAELDFKKIKLNHELESSGEYISLHKDKNPDKPQYDEESPYEITTLRCDNVTDGRHAEVEFINDWRIDAERRDLTINAMFLKLDDGSLIDYFDGESDLKQGIVRFVGDADKRIKEDYLRILRFFRFWSRYGAGKSPDPDTLIVIEQNLIGLDQISGERLWQEIKKVFSHLPCGQVAELMLKLKLFKSLGVHDSVRSNEDEYVKKVLEEINSVQNNVKIYSKILSDKRLSQDLESTADKKMKDLLPVIMFATTIHSQGMFSNTHGRVKFSNLERDSILCILENKQINPPLEELKCHLAMAHVPDRQQTLQRMKAFLVYKGRFNCMEKLESWDVPRFPISGHMVAQEMKKLKIPGSKTKVVLDALKKDWADSNYILSEKELEEKLHDKIDSIQVGV